MKKKNTKIFDYLLIFIGFTLIIYYLINLSTSGPFTFIFAFFICGLFMISYAAIELYKQVNVCSFLPRFVKRTIYILMIIGCIFFGILEGAIIYYGEQSTLKESDALIVLGAGLMQDRVSTTLRYRLDKALLYHKQFPNVPIIVSGGQGYGEKRSEAEAMKEYLIEGGIDEDIIYMEALSTNTYENFKFSDELMNKEKITAVTVTVITNKFHMMRATYIAEKFGFHVFPLPAENYTPQILNNYIREVFAMVKTFIVYR